MADLLLVVYTLLWYVYKTTCVYTAYKKLRLYCLVINDK